MNNKSRIALAIAAAFGTAALGVSSGAIAQTSSVQMGGSLNFFYQYSNPGGGNTPPAVPQGKKHDNLSLSEPEMWIHGEEKIGAMTAWFRCTSSFDLIGTSAANTTGAGQFCGRNSALGFKGNFGNVFAGTWDTPMKLVGGEARGWFGGTASLTGGFANALYNGSGSNTGNTGGTFWERRSRLISYHSPSFSGFTVKGAFSAQNEGTNLTTTTLGTLKPRMYGLSAEYTNGPLYLGLGYERHNDYNPAGSTVGFTPLTQYAGGSDTAYTLAARYTFGFGTRLAALWSPTKFEILNGVDVKKKGWAIFVDHQLSGPHSIKGQYFRVGDIKTLGVSLPDTGAKGWTLAYMYQFSKRTEAGFVYGVMDNEANANYTKGVSTAALGATQKNYGLNIRHRF
jgi:predicted porin